MMTGLTGVVSRSDSPVSGEGPQRVGVMDMRDNVPRDFEPGQRLSVSLDDGG